MSMNKPLIRLEIEGLKQYVIHHFNANNDEFSNAVNEALEAALRPEEVQLRINEAVRHCVNEAIDSVAKDYQLQRAIRDMVGTQIAKLLTGYDEEHRPC